MHTAALATSVGDIEKMKTDFERMREKIRSRPLAPTQAMQGAPEARSFPFPPFLSSRWTTSREDDSVIQSPTDPPTDSPMLKTEAEPSQNDSVAVSRAPNRTPSSGVLPGMSQRPVSREETDGGSEAHELQRGMKIVKTSKGIVSSRVRAAVRLVPRKLCPSSSLTQNVKSQFVSIVCIAEDGRRPL